MNNLNNFNLTVGNRICELRKDHGYTREKLSELADINDKYLYEVEKGIKNISAYKLYKLSRSLEVTMDYLISDDSRDSEYLIIHSLLDTLKENDVKHIEEIIRRILLILNSPDA